MSDWDDPDDALGAQLRRLFEDDRLELRTRAGAEQVIVAGARRRRRRRATLVAGGGVLTALVLVVGGLLVKGLRDTTAEHTTQAAAPQLSVQSSWSSPPQSTVESGFPEGQGVASEVLGPHGYRSLMLGMSYQDAAATGMLPGDGDGRPPAPQSCVTYPLSAGSARIGEVTISGTNGIVRFRVWNARTPEGVTPGTGLKHLSSAYADFAPVDYGFYSASTGTGARYYFTVTNDTVTEVQLSATGIAC
ncbi:hypothetical protein ABZ863_02440 [Saccharomonospora sp. NPDC046836]|uniref:hypothetical protein n=1 Tax=Saccharomonospora sp. NPDC046836 TaxID=3156921 RepID=UPI0033DD73D8